MAVRLFRPTLVSPSTSRTRCVSLLVAALGCAASTALGATIVLTPSKDNTLYESETGSLSNGQGDGIYVGKTGLLDGFHLRRGLLAFNLSAIPPGSIITDVSISLFVVKRAPAQVATPIAVNLHNVLKDWGEGASNGGGAGAPAQPGDATWLHASFSGSLWTTPGGDFRSASSGTTIIDGVNRRFIWMGAGLVADVQAWLNDPSTNFGWAVIGEEIVSESAIRFASSEDFGIPTNPPQLTITYTIPEPSSAVLLATGALAGLRRRRIHYSS